MADQGIFINFNPAIVGPVKVANHTDWIEVYNASYSSSAMAANVGVSSATAKNVRHSVQYGDIGVQLKGGKYTAEIFAAFFKATPFTTITIDMVQQSVNKDGKEVLVVANQLVLHEAFITSYADSMSYGDDMRAFGLTFSFAKLDYTVNGTEPNDKKMAHFDRLNTRASS